MQLVILAAGIGSRYGGPKQIEPIGPGAATLMDYSAYDAKRAGFDGVVLVVSPEFEAEVRAFVRQRSGTGLDVRVAVQRLEGGPADAAAAPPGRSKPWGTGHAVIAAEEHVTGPFAVANADDFYGRDAFVRVADFLRQPHPSSAPVSFANVVYPLGETLSAAGGVNRGLCRVSADGWLQGVEEIRDIRRHDDGAYAGVDLRGREVRLKGDAPVSMNLWAFTASVFPLLHRGFAEFRQRAAAQHDEFLIPHAIQDAIVRGEARVRLVHASGRWIGITYPRDRAHAAAKLRRLVEAGEYPERLWG